jgi:hypothetical protein
MDIKLIIKSSDLVIADLKKFDKGITYLGQKINDDRLEVFEKQIRFQLPLDFIYILKKHNGISLAGIEIYGLDKKLRGSSLDEVYEFEHKEKIYNPMPKYFLPFSPDGRGNHYCLNLSKLVDGICPVVFWQHNFIYNTFDDVEECNNDFMSWIKEIMIESTLEDYNYDGTEK